MTAKEIAEETELLVLKNDFGKREPKALEGAIKEYARQKCKEQREICWRNTYKHLDLHLNKSHGVMEDSENMIRNAPEPKLD